MIDTVRVLCMGAVPPDLRERLSLHRMELVETGELDGSEALRASIKGIVRRTGAVDAAVMDRLPSLEMIANFGVGYDLVDISQAVRRAIAVSNTPDVLDDEVADFTVGLLLATLREIPQANRHLLSGAWGQAHYPLSASLRGRTVGLLGIGRIGQKVARRIEAFNAPVAYHSRTRKPELPWRYFADLKSMAGSVDTLLAIVPGGPETRHLVDRDILAALGATGVLINVSRGSVVDERALREALESRTILAAGLDVFENEPSPDTELCSLPNVVATPHIGSGTHVTRRRMWDLVGDNLISWFEGQPLPSPVPESPLRRRN